jgi:HAD superfamily hydrolase (TIGR01509 family)
MKKYLLLLLLSISKMQGSPSPLLPPAMYGVLRSHNPVTTCINIGYIWYQVLKAAFTAPPPLPTLPTPSTSPRKTVFAFDLHDVIYTPDYSKRMHILTHIPQKLTLFSLITNPLFLYRSVRLATQQIAAEQVIDQLVPLYPQLNLFIPTITEMINAQTPIEGTVEIIKKLKEKGFTLYILSNIGDRVLKDMLTKFPDIFSNFDDFFFCSPEYDYIRKPNPQYYKYFLEKFNLKADQVIFVDDLVKNISAADNLGIHGILFHCPEQLEREITSLGISL